MRAYQRALKTAQRQGLRQGGEAGVKQAMRQGCVTPLTPGATGPGADRRFACCKLMKVVPKIMDYIHTVYIKVRRAPPVSASSPVCRRRKPTAEQRNTKKVLFLHNSRHSQILFIFVNELQ